VVKLAVHIIVAKLVVAVAAVVCLFLNNRLWRRVSQKVALEMIENFSSLNYNCIIFASAMEQNNNLIPSKEDVVSCKRSS
jgi:hypothetical protein